MRKINPVYIRGIKSRMRGVRAPIIISVYLGIVLAFFALVYTGMSNEMGYGSLARPATLGSYMLETLYIILVIILFAVIALMVPAMNAGTIAAEREKQTLDLMLCSPLSASKIIMGKLLSNLTFVTFLLMLVLPFFAIIYLFGTVSIGNMLMLMLFMLVSAYACASVATFYSCLVKRTSVATILSYVTLLLFVIATMIIGFILNSIHLEQYYMNPNPVSPVDTYIPFVWRINPVLGAMELAIGGATGRQMMNPGVPYSSGYYGYIGGIGTIVSIVNNNGMYSHLYSAGFMVVISVILNICSASLIKPVNKLSIVK